MIWIYLYAAFLAVTSLITFLLYAVDKKRAIEKEWRISEKTLLAFSFFGGAVGGYLAMQIVRHKTRHWYFHAVNLLGLAWQIGLLAYLLAA
ncbi:MAG: DUF1294 domain-containing protein [Clostridia bacterium]|nr:DUF1294 domain-containing protein [Clostridia bacterium]